MLRKDGTLFVVMGNNHHYVLSDDEELETYSIRIDAMIRGFSTIKTKGKEWLASEEFKKLKERQREKEKKVLKAVASN